MFYNKGPRAEGAPPRPQLSCRSFFGLMLMKILPPVLAGAVLARSAVARSAVVWSAVVWSGVACVGWGGPPASRVGAETLRVVRGQPCFELRNDAVELAVTELGGHMAPVTFFCQSAQPVQPYYVSPWQEERLPALPAPVLVPLRGDFFCLPFGGNQQPVGEERHSPHGEAASARWTPTGRESSGGVTTLSLALKTAVRRGSVAKRLSLAAGHDVVYAQHVVEGFAGKTPLGHHATLAMPDEEGSVRIAVSPIRFGMTYPGVFSDPQLGEYQALLPGARWPGLERVPRLWKGAADADLSRLPGWQGFADLVQIVPDLSGDRAGRPAWTTATFAAQGYLWFALKDPRVLASTLFWMENRGRHGLPWNGRNNCLGLEDVTAYFAEGLAGSVAENALSREGVATALELTESQPLVVNYIQGVVRIPAGFAQVADVEFAPGQATFVAEGGQRVATRVCHEFLASGKITP